MNMHITRSMAQVDAQGQQMARQLDAWMPELPHDISERLRVARQRALEVQKPVMVRAAAVHMQPQGTLTLSPGDSDRPGLWSVLGSLIPLLVLVAGFSTLMVHEESQRIAEIAHIDAELLADEVPPSAYADPGFVQFLQEKANRREQHD